LGRFGRLSFIQTGRFGVLIGTDFMAALICLMCKENQSMT